MKKSFFAALALFVVSEISAQFLPEQIIAGSTTGFFAVQAADINADGHPDLVSIRGVDAQAVYWHLNDGQGHFPKEPSDSLEIEFQASEAMIDDLNGDGFLDLAFPDFVTTGKVIWYAGNGQGQFVKHPVEYADNIPVGSIDAADIDQDGDLDLVLQQLLFSSFQIRWVANDGQGNFSNPYLIGAHDGGNTRVEIADLNADGLPDVLVPELSAWYFNYGPGYFQSAPLPTGPYALFGVEDVDGDSDKDLLAYGLNGNLVLHRNITTQFTTEEIPVAYGQYDRISVGDYDNDGDPDMMFNSTAWIENDGTGEFTLHNSSFDQNSLYIAPNIILPTAVDFDGDGRVEALIPGGGWVGQVGLSTGGEVVSDIIVPDIVGAWALKTFDFDGDGDQDIMITADKLYWFANEGGGLFGARQTATDLHLISTSFQFADIDGDADLDIIAQSYQLPNSLYPSYMLRNLGFGFYANPITLPFYGPAPLLPFDFDADGDTDIIGGAPLHFGENIGNGNFATPEALTVCYAGTPAAADMDNDGDLDIAVPCDLGVTILENDGAANFTVAQDLALPNVSRKSWWADLDGSGLLDIVVALDSSITWFPRLADDTFGAMQVIYQSVDSEITPQLIQLFDQDSDGDVDIAATASHHILIIENDGTGGFSSVYQPFYIPFISDLAVMDVDDDMDLDLVFANNLIVGWFENVTTEAYISGTCYWDKNENKQRDPGEPPFQKQILRLNPSGKLTFTDEDGSFRLYADPGQYELRISPDSCWALTTDSAAYHLDFDGYTPLGELDFGLALTGTEKKPAAQIATSPTRCGFEVPGLVTILNKGCALTNAVFDLHLDSLVTFISASPPPDVVMPGLLSWQPADTLLPGDKLDIHLVLKIAGPEHLGDTLRILGITRALDQNGNPEIQADSTFLFSVINCAYDPNDKLVNRDMLPENYETAASELVYTIRFQNTGTDTAFHINIRDRLAPELDWSSFRPLGASHPYSVTLDSATRTAVFSFSNILLPDSSANELASHGLVQFSIYPVADLPPGTVISNQAGIYFDFNPPIVTNYAETWVQTTVGVHQPVFAQEKIRLWPNPGSGDIFIDWGAPMPPAGGRLLLTDLTGRLLREIPLPAASNQSRLALGDLPQGMYLIHILAEGRIWRAAKAVKSN
ncbi:MAG: T9SS type A sorting domain-containing protein [Saprospiraceae bacterium]|nr:T9SS type A sorting domain-containing protein [Saprospiraceae bacterium]